MPDDFDFSMPRRAGVRSATEQPIITILVIAFSLLMTAAYWTSDGMKGTTWYAVGHGGVANIFQVWDGRYWALVSCVFLHANPMHILFNMYWMWQLGRAIETSIHPLAYVGFLLASAAIGSGVQIFVSGQTGIGMSGVVYALFGLMWAGRGSYPLWRGLATRENLNLFIGWGVLCIVTTYAGIMNVANGAHAGGFVFGLCVGYLWYAPRRRPIMAVPIVLLSIMTVLSATWMPWSAMWRVWKSASDLHINTSIETPTETEAPDSGGEPGTGAAARDGR